MSDYVYEVKSITGQLMRVYDDKIELTQKGAIGFLTQGLKGTKTYFYSDISTIQFKNCGMTAGFLNSHFPEEMTKKAEYLAVLKTIIVLNLESQRLEPQKN